MISDTFFALTRTYIRARAPFLNLRKYATIYNVNHFVLLNTITFVRSVLYLDANWVTSDSVNLHSSNLCNSGFVIILNCVL